MAQFGRRIVVASDHWMFKPARSPPGEGRLRRPAVPVCIERNGIQRAYVSFSFWLRERQSIGLGFPARLARRACRMPRVDESDRRDAEENDTARPAVVVLGTRIAGAGCSELVLA